MLLSRSQLVVATATTLIKYSSTVAHFTKAPEQEAGENSVRALALALAGWDTTYVLRSESDASKLQILR